MARCEECIHYKMCAWCIDAEHCAFFQEKADVVLKEKFAKDIFADITKAYQYCGVRYNGWALFKEKIAKLKKKYTEDENG